jgi:hypothetical protein
MGFARDRWSIGLGQEAVPPKNPCFPLHSPSQPPCEDVCKVQLPQPDLPQAFKDLLAKYNGAIPVQQLNTSELAIYNQASEEHERNVQAWASEMERRTREILDDYRSRGWSVEARAPRVIVSPGTEPSFSEIAYWVACPPRMPSTGPTPSEAAPSPVPVVPIIGGLAAAGLLAYLAFG